MAAKSLHTSAQRSSLLTGAPGVVNIGLRGFAAELAARGGVRFHPNHRFGAVEANGKAS
jgi:hypothetical protein